MKAAFREEKTRFKPVVLEITLETLEELQALFYASTLDSDDVYKTLCKTTSKYTDELFNVREECDMILDNLYGTIIKKYPELGGVE